jgi:hypothetical protein
VILREADLGGFEDPSEIKLEVFEYHKDILGDFTSLLCVVGDDSTRREQ